MDIKFEKSTDAVKGQITLEIKQADYADKLKDSLKKLRRKAQMPGFRPGMVPMGLIQKMYGNEAKAEEIQKTIAQSLNKYITDEKIPVLGEPLFSEDNKPADIENKDDFVFKFDVALRPEVSVKPEELSAIPYYNIQVDEDTVNKQIDAYRRQTGHNEDAQSYSEGDMLHGSLKENVQEGQQGINLEDVALLPTYFANDEQKALFKDAGKDADIVFTPAKAYEGRDNELASILKQPKEEALKHTGEFTYHINKIDHFVPGELNETLFHTIYPDRDIKTAEDFTAKVKSDIQAQYNQDSDYKFLLDLRDAALKKTGEFPLAEDLLKKMALANTKDENEAKQIDDHFSDYLNDLRWTLLRNDLLKSLNVKVDDTALKETSKRLIKLQMAQYGILNIPEQTLDQFAEERLKDEKQRDNIVNNAINDAMVKEAKKVVKLKEQDISIADFNKMFDQN